VRVGRGKSPGTSLFFHHRGSPPHHPSRPLDCPNLKEFICSVDGEWKKTRTGSSAYAGQLELNKLLAVDTAEAFAGVGKVGVDPGGILDGR